MLADALQDLGDPRGRLVVTQIALERDPWNPDLQRDEVRIIDQHADALLGPLALHRYDDGLELTWHRGFVRAATIQERQQAPSRLLDELLRIPAVESLVALRLGNALDYSSCVDVLVAHRPLLTELSIGIDEGGSALFEDFDLRPLLRALPALETFVGAGGRVGTLDLPRLRRFELHHVADPGELAAARWPLLESLRLGGLHGQDLRPLVDALAATALRSLALLDLDDDYFDGPGDGPGLLLLHVADSALLTRLQHLELGGTIGPDVVAEILARAPAFAHLDTLILGDVQATRGQREALRRIARDVRIGGTD